MAHDLIQTLSEDPLDLRRLGQIEVYPVPGDRREDDRSLDLDRFRQGPVLRNRLVGDAMASGQIDRHGSEDRVRRPVAMESPIA